MTTRTRTRTRTLSVGEGNAEDGEDVQDLPNPEAIVQPSATWVDLTLSPDGGDRVRKRRKGRAGTLGVVELPEDVEGERSTSHQTSSRRRSGFESLRCPICLMPPSPISATICGHLFCLNCIRAAIKASQGGGGGLDERQGRRGKCPVCRTALNLGSVFPLEIRSRNVEDVRWEMAGTAADDRQVARAPTTTDLPKRGKRKER